MIFVFQLFFFLKNGLSFRHVIIQEKLKERERALRKRKEREEQEVERVRSKARRKVAVESYQALLVETIKDPQVWTSGKKICFWKDIWKGDSSSQWG
ncbi:unnamed protein product [Ilex paraguariensis]|uniref:Uncharacterized protein n=1 Tax=Ilex paraguariensis TaxID=185542 RepID=A0ABC8RG42_9AQUA